MKLFGSTALSAFIRKYFGDPNKVKGMGDGTVTGAISMLNNSLSDTGNDIKAISRNKNHWINTDTTDQHAFAIGINFDGVQKFPVPTIKFDNTYVFPIPHIKENTNGVNLYAIQLFRGSDGWYLRLHSEVDGGSHVFQVKLQQVI